MTKLHPILNARGRTVCYFVVMERKKVKFEFNNKHNWRANVQLIRCTADNINFLIMEMQQPFFFFC